jgi:hypothetical protein
MGRTGRSVWKQGDVEIRAHAEGCAIRAMPRFHRGAAEARFGGCDAEEEAIKTELATHAHHITHCPPTRPWFPIYIGTG